MIRTKKMTYCDSPAIAIYFLNMSQHFKKMKLES